MLIISLILLQLAIFAVLISVFRRIMSKNVVSATSHLEQISQDYAKKEAEIAQKMEEAEKEAQKVLSKAYEEGGKLKDQIMKEAEAQRDDIFKAARLQSEGIIQQADKSRALLLAEIEEKVAKEAIQKACELIQHALPEQLKQEVHRQWLEELLESGFNQLEHLRIPEGVKEVKVVSAFSLDNKQQELLSKKIKALLGEQAVLTVDVDSGVVAGMVINIGSMVLDGSLKNRIQEKTKHAV